MVQLHFINLNSLFSQKWKDFVAFIYFFIKSYNFLVPSMLLADKDGALTNCTWIVSLIKTPSDSLQPSELAEICLRRDEVS